MFPSPGSVSASPATQISFRGVSAARLGRISVVGSRSGRHTGRVAAHSDGRGASFLPSRRFDPGERVTVRTDLRIRGARDGDFAVCIAEPVRVDAPLLGERTGEPGDTRRFVTRKDLSPPKLSVVVPAHRTAPGYLFYAPKIGPGDNGPTIADDRGEPVWLKPVAAPTEATSFTVQRLHGKPVLTWWQGTVDTTGTGKGAEVIADSSYRTIATIKGANGLRPDLHEFRLTPRGTALVTAYQAVSADLRSVGGPRDGAVLDSVVQEIDIPTGLVLFEWHSVGNVPLTDAFNDFDIKNMPGLPFDAFHANSIDVLPDGDLLVSGRSTWTLYDIDHDTGRIVWRLGGRRPSFRIGPDAGTAWQHDARVQPDGTITVFDNEAAPGHRARSRGIVLRVDPAARTVRLVEEYDPTSPSLLSANQGSLQALPNGDVLLGWGNHPWMTELDRRGRTVFQARLPEFDQSYRVARSPWVGHPTGTPAVVARRSGRSTAVYVSWNGATEVRRWQVLAGARPGRLHPVRSAAQSGFETRVAVRGRPAYVAVRALDRSGRALGTSRPVAARGG